jgi:hypothetical protein
LLAAALEVQRFFKRRKWRFCIIGGLAVLRWGEPRATQDVDLSLLTGFRGEEKFVDAILDHFAPRGTDARQFALTSRVVLCTASNGVTLDIALAGWPFEEKAISRASAYTFTPRVSLVTASAEDVIVMKAFAGREKDWDDIRGIVKTQAALDWGYIEHEVRPLLELKDDLSPLDRLRAVREERESDE